MNKINFNEALKAARMINLSSDKVNTLTVKDASNKFAGQILYALSELHGPMEDEYYDAFIVKHWAESLEMLEHLIQEENLTPDDEVQIIYNEETDIFEVRQNKGHKPLFNARTAGESTTHDTLSQEVELINTIINYYRHK